MHGRHALLDLFAGEHRKANFDRAVYVQVNGSLSYSDKILDGFYNILGMNPHLWVMCNELDEGRRLPSLAQLKAVDPMDSLMEVVLVDGYVDADLKELEDKALELYYGLGNTLELVEQLGKLVSQMMG